MTQISRQWWLPFAVLLIFGAIALVVTGCFTESKDLGTWGQWAGAFGGITAASVALYLATESQTENRRLEERKRDQTVWSKAVSLGVELWVEVDRALTGHVLQEWDQKRHQVGINALMASAEHRTDEDLDQYSLYLCKAVWQPLVALTTEIGGDVTAIITGLDDRQPLLGDLNAVADMKSTDLDVSLSELDIPGILDAAELGIDWD